MVIPITSADLERARQKRASQRAAEPVPMAEVVARCATAKATYSVLFRSEGPDRWAAAGTRRPTAGDAHGGGSAATLQGTLVWDGYRGCPHCRREGIVKCGACARLTCATPAMLGGKRQFECGWCGAVGYVAGSITSLDAQRSGGAKGAK